MQNKPIPFSQQYVLALTLRKMGEAIDHSVRKTIGRLADFADDSEKKREILNTLASLERMRKLLDEIVENNEDLFIEGEI